MEHSSPRLNKYLADQGLGSRRTIDQWITQGRLARNGQTVQLGDRHEEGDLFALDGKRLKIYGTRAPSQSAQLLIYHKPRGEVSTTSDPEGRRTIFDALPKLEPSAGRWIQIGRLDLQTSGLKLFTNHGLFANKLMHPSGEIEREYIAKVRGQYNPDDRCWTKGADVGDERPIMLAAHELLESLESSYWVRIVLKEGRYRAVRRFFEANSQTVVKLQRIRFGTIELENDLQVGEYRWATDNEFSILMESCETHER